MKLVRKTADGSVTALKTAEKITKLTLAPWKVLIVDDETDIHTITRLALQEFQFANRPLQILQAMSGMEAREILTAEPEIAVALIDVVMETDDAGLQLIDFIRNQLKYSLIRLIIRTGQPGMSPEREVIERYDINDYKSKTELRADKLYTTMRMALKSYHDLLTLDSNRKALRKILEAVPEFHHAASLNQFFNGVLSQLIGLCNLGENSLIAVVSSGLVITADNHQQIVVQAGTGDFAQPHQNPKVEAIRTICSNLILGKPSKAALPDNALLIPIEIKQKPIGFVYLENANHLNPADLDLTHIMVNQCATALENLQLYFDLKEANQETSDLLKRAEIANQAKTAFLANVSHELRTPLNGILGGAQLLQMDNSLNSEQQQQLDVVIHSGHYLLAIVDDVLEFSQLETGQLTLHPHRFRLEWFLNGLVREFQQRATQKRLNFFYEPSPALPAEIDADEKRVRQIIFNLLSNAVKFTPRGKIQFSVDYADETLKFQVKDTGLGIAPEHLDKIFLPFESLTDWRHKSEGAGLGLTITQKWVTIMGGELTVDSTFGKGSLFAVTLKLPAFFDKTTALSPPQSLIVGYEGPRRKILVIDDGEESRLVLIELLKPLGFELEEANNGQTGLEKVLEFKPDLVITDLVMPVMDGFELIRQIRQQPTFQVVPIFAYSTDFLEEPQSSMGYDAFLVKPVCPQELLDAVQKQLELRWIIEVKTPAVPTDDISPVVATDKTELLESLTAVPLSAEQASILYNLGMMGDFEGLIKQAGELEQQHQEWQPVAALIRQLAEIYQSDEICELVQPYLQVDN
jgi:signal transduction histidine kinase/DNA-binding response OmpR family regulator